MQRPAGSRRRCVHGPHRHPRVAARRPQPASRARHAAAALGSATCSLHSEYKRNRPIDRASNFAEYALTLDSRLLHVPLPLGAKLASSGDGDMVLQVPRLAFLDLYVHPISTLHVSHPAGGGVHICTRRTEISGSHHVEALGLKDLFDMDLKVWVDTANGELLTKAAFQLDLQVPFPFSLSPMGLIRDKGNIGVRKILNALMDALVEFLVQDYKAWTAALEDDLPAALPVHSPR